MGAAQRNVLSPVAAQSAILQEISPLRILLKFSRVARRTWRKFLQKRRTGPQPGERTFLEAAPTCDFLAIFEVYTRQLRAISQHLDIACDHAATHVDTLEIFEASQYSDVPCSNFDSSVEVFE